MFCVGRRPSSGWAKRQRPGPRLSPQFGVQVVAKCACVVPAALLGYEVVVNWQLRKKKRRQADACKLILCRCHLRVLIADAQVLAVRGGGKLAASQAQAAAGGGMQPTVGQRGAGGLGGQPHRQGLRVIEGGLQKSAAAAARRGRGLVCGVGVPGFWFRTALWQRGTAAGTCDITVMTGLTTAE